MKTRIYIAILTLILLAGIIIIYRSPPPDVVVQEVAVTITVPAVVVVETVASTIEATKQITETPVIPISPLPSATAVGVVEVTKESPTSLPVHNLTVIATTVPTKNSTAEPTMTTISTSTPLPTPTTYIPYQTPIRIPIQTAIHNNSLQTEAMAIQNWLTYSDTVSGISFQYPPEWEILESKLGVFVDFLQDERGHYIYFAIRKNPNNLFPFEYLIEEILQYRTNLTKTLLLSEVQQFSGNSFDGAIYQEKDSNVVSRIIINYRGMTIRLYLRIRGEVGGFPPPSSDYNSTEQEILKLIDSLQLNGTK